MCLKHLCAITSRSLLIIILIICLGVFIMANVMEHYFGVQACKLCHYERTVFMATGVIAFLGLLFPKHSRYWTILILGLAFLGGFALAGYHVAVQQHWVSLPSFCAANDFSAFDSVEALKEQLLNTPFVRCDQITWSLFGLSLAAYNALLSLFLALLCGAWLWKQR